MSLQLTIQEQVTQLTLQVNDAGDAVNLTVQELQESIELTVEETIGTGTAEPNIITAPAGAIMSSGVAVVLVNGVAMPYNHLAGSEAGKIIGFAVHSSTVGAALAIRFAGIMQNDGYAFTPGQVVFATAAGLSTTAPVTGTLAPVGQAIAPDKFIINFLTPINRT